MEHGTATDLDGQEPPKDSRLGSKKDPKSPDKARVTPKDPRLVALDALLASPNFRASERNKRFLRFVVEETLAGRAERIKAFTVAVDVFGRDANFDASMDPIVRVAAGHLRRSLQDYYSTHGKGDTIRIHLPVGTYVPNFEIRENLQQRAIKQVSAIVADRKRRLTSGTVGVFLALGAASAALAYMTFGPSLHDVPQKPVIVVDSARTHALEGAEGNAMADMFTQSLWVALGGNKAVRVVGVRPEEEMGDVLAQTKTSFSAEVPLYQLLTSLETRGGELQVYWHILDGRSNETYFSASAKEALSAIGRDGAPERIAQNIADSLELLTGVTSLDAPPTEDAANDRMSMQVNP